MDLLREARAAAKPWFTGVQAAVEPNGTWTRFYQVSSGGLEFFFPPLIIAPPNVGARRRLTRSLLPAPRRFSRAERLTRAHSPTPAESHPLPHEPRQTRRAPPESHAVHPSHARRMRPLSSTLRPPGSCRRSEGPDGGPALRVKRRPSRHRSAGVRRGHRRHRHQAELNDLRRRSRGRWRCRRTPCRGILRAVRHDVRRLLDLVIRMSAAWPVRLAERSSNGAGDLRSSGDEHLGPEDAGDRAVRRRLAIRRRGPR